MRRRLYSRFARADWFGRNVSFNSNVSASADRYGLDRLRLLSKASLCQDVAINTVATTLALGEQNHCFQLKAVCLRFEAMPENLKAMMQTDGYEYLKESCPSVLTELLEYVARVGEQSSFLLTHGGDGALDGSYVNSRRVKPILYLSGTSSYHTRRIESGGRDGKAGIGGKLQRTGCVRVCVVNSLCWSP